MCQVANDIRVRHDVHCQQPIFTIQKEKRKKENKKEKEKEKRVYMSE